MTKAAKKMAADFANCLLQECHDTNKATSDCLSYIDSNFGWCQTTNKEHYACLGKIATNDPTESLFALLTHQLQSFGQLLCIHFKAVGHACFNWDFSWHLKNPNNNGAFYQLLPDMHDSLLQFALGIAPEIRKTEKAALDRQCEAKHKRIKLLRETKIISAQRECANTLTYIDMFGSSVCWKTVS